ncbi:MAG: ubiquinone biosynthesis hydroxylase [Bauldia sp.]
MARPRIGGTSSDVAIAGGGQIGLALGLAVRRSAPNLTVTLIDATPPGAADRVGRASTITAGSRRLMERLGVWRQIATEAQPVTAMVVTDSRTNDAVRPVFLTFDTGIETSDAVAHLVPDGVVVRALRRAAEASGVRFRSDAVSDFSVEEGRVTVRTGGAKFGARLLVAADGADSRLRALAGIDTVGWSYGQSGIVTTVAHARAHGGRAEEHFLPGGPFAILPLKPTEDGANRSSLVWTEPADVAERLVAGDRLSFHAELERRFGHRLGSLRVIDPPRAFPLRLAIARAFVSERLALVGDAAHVIHPLAGQGLNLGYRDVAALAETIVEAGRLGLDIGALSVLERYQRWRRADTVGMALVTDGLNRLFSNDNPGLRILRDVGLGLVDRLPQVKRLFIGEAAGEAGEPPRLLRGEAI